ncbi:hypothetical protein V8J88_09050 [Massilia sp. W12]|uniref:hypothetical protein n=1 Tax=Massilia sp. W12 TaxID=3126507 RepID=UPI0030D4C486
MSNYDLALIVDATTFNKGLQQAFSNPQTKSLFSGSQTVGSAGITSLDWSIDTCPVFNLTPPTAAQWNDPATFFPGPGGKPANGPSDQMFQISITTLSFTLNQDGGGKIPGTCSPLIFAQLSLNGDVQLQTVGMQFGNVPAITGVMLEIMASVLYGKVNQLLGGYKIPHTIALEGQKFNDPVMQVAAGHLILASTLSTNGTVDISQVTFPAQALGILLSRNLLSQILASYASGIEQVLDQQNVNHSGSNWTGSYSINGGISGAKVALDSALPAVDVSANISAEVKLGVAWWAVPAACAIEAASNLL